MVTVGDPNESGLLSEITLSTANILVYNPGKSNVVQAVTAAFPSPEVTQASSAAQVAAAFSSNATRKSAGYAAGLVIPPGFDDSLKSGAHPSLQLYLDGNDVDAQTEALVRSTIAS